MGGEVRREFLAHPEVPPLLRKGANPAFHKGFGELTDLAAPSVGNKPASLRSGERQQADIAAPSGGNKPAGQPS
jgi:hypothetical protein